MIFNLLVEQVLKTYYPTLEKMLAELALYDYKEQNLSLNFSLGKINITVYGEVCDKEFETNK